MLRTLHIRNYALIAEITIEFERGLNIITGETGAGKSIILGAFGLLMGDRASSEVVRTGTDKTIVEAEFDIEGNPRLETFLTEHAIEIEQHTLIVRREVLARGTGRGFINDTPATAQLLKELAGFLVDLHGQHEHQSLLHTDGHIVLLDDYGDLTKQLRLYQTSRTASLALQEEIAELVLRNRKLQEERDLYEFQLEEIAVVSPKESEDIEIENDLKVLENAEELQTAAKEIHKLLYDGEPSSFEFLSKAKLLMEQYSKIDSTLEAQLPEINVAIVTIRELSRFFLEYSDRIELDPARLDELRQRILAINRLKRKFGGTLQTVLQKQAALAQRLGEGEVLEETISAKQLALNALQIETTKAALALSNARKQVGNKLAPQVVSALKELGIEDSKFEVRMTHREIPNQDAHSSPVCIDGIPIAANARGIDFLEFYLSTNLGEDPKPLAKVASGGEVSRIMLALKTLLAKNDRLPLMVFDEIDVGVSGRTAQKVGRTMKQLAAAHQIIAISHLSQIAAFADTHFLVEKRVENKTTTSRLRKLTASEHVSEVARLLSGATLSESSLQAAQALIIEAEKESST